ncbi:aminoacyl-tRNA hydrolase [Oceanirhabdus seepicola]|uniref:Peptidyl-tRNA hydrolase n=1 Tax=Oceanirhabdus seepicola TaxID=2828781 RepID=A0A9J6P9B3_9CLOT|nr:aminoacyl-tRNA hydrolase [Oceanirhabdus seepicola]MCM1992061.1 aminoacyl-tRNA hydrolase [Oceanirhabdus seepicola]
MYLVVGLGNPGVEYENTRHNVGFKVIDKLIDMYKISMDRKKFKGICVDLRIGSEKVILLKPQTYMNLSGESVVEVVNYFDIPNENIIVLHDDVSIDVGRLRIRKNGSSGGQNGIKNIIKMLNSDEFNRVKIGVGKAQHDMISHVLGKFPTEEEEVMEKVYDQVVKSVVYMIENNVDKAMNVFNGYNAYN